MEEQNTYLKKEQTSSTNVYLSVLFAVVTLILGVVTYDAYSNSPKTNQYEYKIEFFEDGSCDDGLNKFGNEGWQVVGSRRAQSSSYSSSYGYEFVLMREKK